jgi:hypothetical protein
MQVNIQPKRPKYEENKRIIRMFMLIFILPVRAKEMA